MAESHTDPLESSRRLVQMLEAKYDQTGQDLEAYLEGLLYQDYLNYWDYIHLDTLLTLQKSRTKYPDEQIFIIYHQITELNFKLILAELAQISALANPDEATLLKRISRVNRYLENLISSFSVMTDGMDQEQFLRFRMALMPASGFQSAQFRFIEIASTDGWLLVEPSKRIEENPNLTPAEIYEQMYWRKGATEEGNGNKTLTLRRFEAKYESEILTYLTAYRTNNLRQQYKKVGLTKALHEALFELDKLFNLDWRHMHLRSAVRYLHRNPTDIPATGGTNWMQYLPPAQQQTRFFPEFGPWKI